MITKFSTCLLFLALLLNSCQRRNQPEIIEEKQVYQPTSPQYEPEYDHPFICASQKQSRATDWSSFFLGEPERAIYGSLSERFSRPKDLIKFLDDPKVFERDYVMIVARP